MINHEIACDAVVKKAPPPPFPFFERARESMSSSFSCSPASLNDPEMRVITKPTLCHYCAIALSQGNLLMRSNTFTFFWFLWDNIYEHRLSKWCHLQVAIDLRSAANYVGRPDLEARWTKPYVLLLHTQFQCHGLTLALSVLTGSNILSH